MKMSRTQRTVPYIIWLLVAILCFRHLPADAVELRDYHITVDPADLEEMLSRPFEDIYIDCAFEYDGFIWDDARVRLRGESSREYPKKSYKINFDADNRFGLRDKINLISCWTDPSFIREHLSYDAYARAGLPASRTWFVRFFVNDVYFGLYLDVEQVDEHFLSYTDLPDDGTLYKADDAGALLWSNENIQDVWDQETNTNLGYDSLYALRDWLDQCPVPGFDKLLVYRFDVASLERIIALNAIIGNQSTYYHNYYLLQDSYGDGKWTYLPWDMDRTFYYWTDYTQPFYFRSGHQGDFRTNPLIAKCWLNPVIRQAIVAQLEDLSATLFAGDYYDNYISELHELLYDAVDADTTKQYTIEYFESDLAWLPDAIRNRCNALREQIENNPTPFLLKRTILNGANRLLHWTESLTLNGDPITYRLWISDNAWFTGDNVTIIDLDTPYYLLANPTATDIYFRVYAYSPDGDSTQAIAYFEEVTNGLEDVAGTIVLGSVTGNRTFSRDDGTILLPEGLTVEPGASLSLEPGAVVKLGGESTLRVDGQLSISGSATDSVYILPLAEEQPWCAVFIEHPAAPVNIAYAVLRGGGVFYHREEQGSMVFVRNGIVNITDCTFRDACRGAGGITTAYSTLLLDRVDMELDLESFTGEQFLPDAVSNYDTYLTVQNCRIAKTAAAQYGGDLIDGEHAISVLIRNNVLENPGDDAIDFDVANEAVIYGNRIHGCRDNAFSLGTVFGFRIFNNIIENCANGVFAKDSSSMELYNNVFANCGSALRLNPYIPPQEVIIRNCAFQENSVNIDPDENNAVDARYCAFSGTAAYPGEGNISGDLKFADAEHGDFRLLGDSPLIDAGWGTGCPEFDIQDSMRVDAENVNNTGAGEITYVDIGAYEYQSDGVLPPPPVSYMFLENYPNPFNAATTFSFGIVRAGKVELAIYDRLGRRVYGEVWNNMQVGLRAFHWSGTTNNGRSLASGLYFARLKQPAGVTTRKVVLIR